MPPRLTILMMTNTYTPFVGGIERSIKDFTAAFRRRGHRVVIVAPVHEGMPSHEPDVIRVPAIRGRFRGSAFSVALPTSLGVLRALRRLRPHLIHAHHPFLIGNTALRLAHTLNAPLVYTHHVRFEEYTHYLPLDSPMTERFMAQLSTAYANLADQVIAPSESVAALLRTWGAQRPIAVVPTGVEIHRFAHGDGAAARRAFGIPREAFLVGHIGRLAPEKNLVFLAQALVQCLRACPTAHAFIAGRGSSDEDIRQTFRRARVAGRLHMAGILGRQQLVDCYHAMDVFAFASKTETQGIVLIEAMAAGVPVVALDASGVREVVHDGENGRLLCAAPRVEDYVKALRWVATAAPRTRRELRKAAQETAARFSQSRCAQRALALYRAVIGRGRAARVAHDGAWARTMRRMKTEWQLLRSVTQATGAALTRSKAGLESSGDDAVDGSHVDGHCPVPLGDSPEDCRQVH